MINDDKAGRLVPLRASPREIETKLTEHYGAAEENRSNFHVKLISQVMTNLGVRQLRPVWFALFGGFYNSRQKSY